MVKPHPNESTVVEEENEDALSSIGVEGDNVSGLSEPLCEDPEISMRGPEDMGDRSAGELDMRTEMSGMSRLRLR